jgi:DNA polymerase II large subunit
MNKQTAVEWLSNQIECFGNKHELQMSWNTLEELVEQAKEMEKEQIIKAFDEGQEYEYQYHINSAPKFYAETYYQETYKQD